VLPNIELGSTGWRVGDVPPLITTSRGTTRIYPDGVPVYSAPKSKGKSENNATHEDSPAALARIYVNDLAREAVSGETQRAFPEGSIIVREKLSAPDGKEAEALVVMFKRAQGFNPKAGDWEFLAVDGALKKIQERQKQGSCADCHASQLATDFVFPLTTK
jgi:hypothetical protein